MSFGFSVGDFLVIVISKLCWSVYKKCKDSKSSYTDLTGEITALYAVIKETEELLDQEDIPERQLKKLIPCQQSCNNVLKDLETLLKKYEKLGTQSGRVFDRMRFGDEDIAGVRQRITMNITMLDSFINASSHLRLERKLNLLIAEVQAGKREGSVISAEDFESKAQSDEDTWNSLRMELEDVGVSTEAINDNRDFIIHWFREAVKASRLEEEVSLDENESSSGVDGPIAPVAFAVSGRSPTIPVRNQPLSAVDILHERSASSAYSDQSLSTTFGIEPEKSAPKAMDHTPLVDRTDPKKSRFSVLALMRVLQSKDAALLKGAGSGNEALVKDALAKGADIQACDRHGQSVLHLAARRLDINMLKLLLENNANVNMLNASGYTCLMEACCSHQPSSNVKEVLRLLLRHGADPEFLKDDKSVLEMAVERRSVVQVKTLLRSGARVDPVSPNTETSALLLAVLAGDEAIVRLLVEHGADLYRKFHKPLFIRFDEASEPQSIFTKAAYTDTPRPKLQLLMELGVHINDYVETGGLTALMHAARNGMHQAVKILLELGAEVRLKSQDGKTTLRLAMEGNVAAERSFFSRYHRTPADIAEFWSKWNNITRALLEKGASLESKDTDRVTVWQFMVLNGGRFPGCPSQHKDAMEKGYTTLRETLEKYRQQPS